LLWDSTDPRGKKTENWVIRKRANWRKQKRGLTGSKIL